jgi:hypothetical protein
MMIKILTTWLIRDTEENKIKRGKEKVRKIKINKNIIRIFHIVLFNQNTYIILHSIFIIVLTTLTFLIHT